MKMKMKDGEEGRMLRKDLLCKFSYYLAEHGTEREGVKVTRGQDEFVHTPHTFVVEFVRKNIREKLNLGGRIFCRYIYVVLLLLLLIRFSTDVTPNLPSVL